LHWTTDTAQGFAALAMSDVGNGLWAADIPVQPAGTEVFYYVEGEANSGKVQVRPIVAPDGWWRFRVLDINTGIAEAGGPAIAEVYPNPTSSLLVVELASEPGTVLRMRLTDALGREVMALHAGPLHADRRVFADLSGLAPGTYLVVAESATGRSVQRVVKH
jgi:hypothetical protein